MINIKLPELKETKIVAFRDLKQGTVYLVHDSCDNLGNGPYIGVLAASDDHLVVFGSDGYIGTFNDEYASEFQLTFEITSLKLNINVTQ